MKISLLRSLAPLLSWGLLSLLGSACSVQTLSDGERSGSTRNSCDSDDVCSSGRCVDGMCVASSSDVGSLLLEVTPPVGVAGIAGIRFTTLVHREELEQRAGAIELEHVSRIRGSVIGKQLEDRSCVPAATESENYDSRDGSLSARVTLIPRQRLLGLPSPSHTTEATWTGELYNFALQVPPGKYDIYVEPLGQDRGCVRPPTLRVAEDIPARDVKMSLSLPDPELLTVRVRWPYGTDDLSGWTVDIVERDAGRLLSNRSVLENPAQTVDGLEYVARLAFSEVSGDLNEPVSEIVRLSPPEGWVAPTVFIERSVVELFQGGEGLIDQLSQLPSSVHFSGRVSRRGNLEPAPSVVTLMATQLASVSPGTLVSFSRTVTTDELGVFALDLLPGEYRVIAEPTEAGLALTEERWTVSAAEEVQAGRVIEVLEQPTVSGQIISFDGVPVVGAWIQATPTLVLSSGVLSAAQGKGLFRPRSVNEASVEQGFFSLTSDRGSYDFIVQPETLTNFAWGVRLGVDIQNDKQELGQLPLSLPYVIEGSLRSHDIGLVPSALIRAYVYVKDGNLAESQADATSLIAIAEARVDERGKYRLLLPSRFK